jgi:hypothetical protein
MDMGESLQGEIKARETAFEVCACHHPLVRAYTPRRTSSYKLKRWYLNGTLLLLRKMVQIRTGKTRKI